MRISGWASGFMCGSQILCQAQPGEDLAALWQVPIAEGAARYARARRPRATAQYAIGAAEEDFGVLAVRICLEAAVAIEVACGPLPHSAGVGEDAAVPGVYTSVAALRSLPPGRRPLPLSLRRQTGLLGSGEGIGLEPAHMAHGRLRVARRRVRVMRDVVLLLPRPALIRPPLAPFIAAALAEAQPAGFAHRAARDVERARVRGVA